MIFRRDLTHLAHLFKAVVKQHHLELRPFLKTIIPVDGVVIDVGGHAGQFSKLFSRIVSHGHVYTFEPGQYALSILRQAIKLNRIKNVTITPMGLSDTCESLSLEIPIKESGVVRFGLSHFGRQDGVRSYEQNSVDATTLDEFFTQHQLKRLDFIKADIEGWELRMLKGGRNCLSTYRPALMIEVSQQHLERAGDSIETFWQFMHDINYQPFILGQNLTELVSLNKKQDGDIFWLPIKSN
jgi:FkbM family methyltransferase